MTDMTKNLRELRKALSGLSDRIVDPRIARLRLFVNDVLDENPDGSESADAKLVDLTESVQATQAGVQAAKLTALLVKIERFLQSL